MRSRHKKSPNPIYLSLPSLASHMNRIISGETYEEKIESERKETERVTEEARKRRLTDHHWFLQRAMELSNLKEPYSDLINLIRG